MPPLVTISSAAPGRRPCSCSWRSSRYSRTLGDALDRRVLERDGRARRAAPARRSRRARRSGNVSGFGKPPVSDSTPGGAPARIAVSSSPPRARCGARTGASSQRASTSTVKASALSRPASSARHVLGVVRLVVQRLAARRSPRGSRARRGRSPPPSPARPRSARRGDHDAVVVAEDDVAGRDVDAAAAHRRAQRRAGDGGARRRGGCRARTPAGRARAGRARRGSSRRSRRRRARAGAPRWRTARRAPRAGRRWWRSRAPRRARPRPAR